MVIASASTAILLVTQMVVNLVSILAFTCALSISRFY